LGLIVDSVLASGWPHHGRILIQDVTVSYTDGPVILKGISARIKEGEKVSCVTDAALINALPLTLFEDLNAD